jgi:hypothetical protein
VLLLCLLLLLLLSPLLDLLTHQSLPASHPQMRVTWGLLLPAMELRCLLTPLLVLLLARRELDCRPAGVLPVLPGPGCADTFWPPWNHLGGAKAWGCAAAAAAAAEGWWCVWAHE